MEDINPGHPANELASRQSDTWMQSLNQVTQNVQNLDMADDYMVLGHIQFSHGDSCRCTEASGNI